MARWATKEECAAISAIQAEIGVCETLVEATKEFADLEREKRRLRAAMANLRKLCNAAANRVTLDVETGAWMTSEEARQGVLPKPEAPAPPTFTKRLGKALAAHAGHRRNGRAAT